MRRPKSILHTLSTKLFLNLKILFKILRPKQCRGVYSSIIPPPPPGVGKKNQRVLGLGKKIKEE